MKGRNKREKTRNTIPKESNKTNLKEDAAGLTQAMLKNNGNLPITRCIVTVYSKCSRPYFRTLQFSYMKEKYICATKFLACYMTRYSNYDPSGNTLFFLLLLDCYGIQIPIRKSCLQDYYLKLGFDSSKIHFRE